MKKMLLIILLSFSLIKVNSQEGFSLEANIGLALGDSRELFSYTFQGNFQYLWSVSDNINLGGTIGVLVFLGEGNNVNGSNVLFGSIPDIYLPIAIASRVNLSRSFYSGLDIGYALSANAFDGGEGGFYFRPMLACKVKKKLALMLSYASINEDNYSASTISLGVNFGF